MSNFSIFTMFSTSLNIYTSTLYIDFPLYCLNISKVICWIINTCGKRLINCLLIVLRFTRLSTTFQLYHGVSLVNYQYYRSWHQPVSCNVNPTTLSAQVGQPFKPVIYGMTQPIESQPPALREDALSLWCYALSLRCSALSLRCSITTPPVQF